MRKRIAVLGSTGSIGSQTLEVAERFPDKFEVVGLAAGFNLDKLAQQAEKFKPRLVSIGRPEDVPAFRNMVTYLAMSSALLMRPPSACACPHGYSRAIWRQSLSST